MIIDYNESTFINDTKWADLESKLENKFKFTVQLDNMLKLLLQKRK